MYANIIAFFIGVLFGLSCFVAWLGFTDGLYDYIMYKRAGRLLDFDDLEDEINSGCRIIIIGGNLIFNGIVLEPDEEKYDRGDRNGQLIRKVRVTKSYLKRRFPSADIHIVDAVYYV